MFNSTVDRGWIPIKKVAINKSGYQWCVWTYYFLETNESMMLSYYKKFENQSFLIDPFWECQEQTGELEGNERGEERKGGMRGPC